MPEEQKAQQPEPEAPQPEEPELPPVDVLAVMRTCIILLQEQAWVAMGLVTHPTTKKIEKDLAHARLAIDSIAFLAEQMAGHGSAAENRQLQAMVSDLRLNYVNQSKATEEPKSEG